MEIVNKSVKMRDSRFVELFKKYYPLAYDNLVLELEKNNKRDKTLNKKYLLKQ